MSDDKSAYFSVEIIKMDKKYHDIYVYDSVSNLSFRPYSKIKMKHLEDKVTDVFQHFKNENWSTGQLQLDGNEPEWQSWLGEVRDKIW